MFKNMRGPGRQNLFEKPAVVVPTRSEGYPISAWRKALRDPTPNVGFFRQFSGRGIGSFPDGQPANLHWV